MRSILALAVLAAALAPAMGAASPDAVHVVAASNFAWTPDDLSVSIGDRVEFVLSDGFHTWELEDGSEPCDLPCVRTFETAGSVSYRCGVHPSMTGVVRVGEAPVVDVVGPSPGAVVTGTVLVEGTATHSSADVVSVSVQLADAPPVEATLTGSGGSVAWHAFLPTANVMDGERAIVATARSASGFAGSDVVVVVVDNPLTLDLALASASAQAAALTSNRIDFTLDNDGNDAAQDVTVAVDYLYRGTWRPIGGATFAEIAYRGSVSGSVTWATGASPHVGAFPVRVTIDPAHALPDPDRANNAGVTNAGWFTSALPGVVLTEP